MKRNPHKIAALIAVLTGLLLHGSAEAIETIRVALFLNSPAVVLSTDSELNLTAADGASLLNHRTTHEEIAAGSHGLVIGKRPTGLKALTAAASNGGDIHINGLTIGGIVQIILDRDALLVINELDIEEYLKGVVPLEVSANWHPAALQVQAIIARTYALYQKQTHLGKEYDLLATTADQLYGGKGKAHPAANRAIAETAGKVVTFGGQLILSAYHSTSAGPTENASEVWGLSLPYLNGVNCPFDRNSPYYQWTKAIPMDRLQEALSTAGYPVGTVASITPFRWTEAGRINQIRLLHSQGELILKAEDLRRILGYSELPSTQFWIEKIGREIRIQGRGYGHAVGLCQWGAKEMADMGYSTDAILKYYYPGVRIEPYSALTDEGQTP